jgi:hypothetical protein
MSIHESSGSKEENLHEYLIYDAHERRFGLDLQLDSIPAVDDFRHNRISGQIIRYSSYHIQNPDRCAVSFSGPVEKRIEISEQNKKTYRIAYSPCDTLLGVEFSIGLFRANLRIDTGQVLKDLIVLEELASFSIQGDDLEPIAFSMNHPCTLLSYPIETVSSSESGYEKNFQGCCILLIFTSGEDTTIAITL